MTVDLISYFTAQLSVTCSGPSNISSNISEAGRPILAGLYSRASWNVVLNPCCMAQTLLTSKMETSTTGTGTVVQPQLSVLPPAECFHLPHSFDDLYTPFTACHLPMALHEHSSRNSHYRLLVVLIPRTVIQFEHFIWTSALEVQAQWLMVLSLHDSHTANLCVIIHSFTGLFEYLEKAYIHSFIHLTSVFRGRAKCLTTVVYKLVIALNLVILPSSKMRHQCTLERTSHRKLMY